MEIYRKTPEVLHAQARRYLEWLFRNGFNRDNADKVHEVFSGEGSDPQPPVDCFRRTSKIDAQVVDAVDSDFWGDYVSFLKAHRENLVETLKPYLEEEGEYQTYLPYFLKIKKDARALHRPFPLSISEKHFKAEEKRRSKITKRLSGNFIGSGSAAHVYRFTGPENQMFIAKLFNEGNTLKASGVTYEIITQARAGRHFKGRRNLAQHIATNIDDRISIWRWEEGKPMNIPQTRIPDEHMEDYLDLVDQFTDQGGVLDAGRFSNFLYDPNRGIILLDYNMVNLESQPRNAQLIHKTKALGMPIIYEFFRNQRSEEAAIKEWGRISGSLRRRKPELFEELRKEWQSSEGYRLACLNVLGNGILGESEINRIFC